MRKIPHDLEAEQWVLGGLLLEGGNPRAMRKVEGLDPSQFYRPSNGLVFKAVVSLMRQGAPVDVVTVRDELQRVGWKADDGQDAAMYLLTIMDAVPTSANLEYHAGIVAALAKRRDVIRVATEVATMAYDDAKAMSEIEAKLQTFLFSGGSGSSFSDGMSLAVGGVNRASKRSSTSGVTGIETGFRMLDQALDGLKPGRVYLVAGRPGSGKSAFGAHLALDVACRTNPKTGTPYRVLFFSIEMSEDEIIDRTVFGRAGLPTRLNGALTKAQSNAVNAVFDDVYKSGLMMDDSPDLSVDQLISKSMSTKAESGLDLVVLDYVQYVTNPLIPQDKTAEIIASVAECLRFLARKLSVPVVALSQLNREVEKRDDKRPMMSDLAGSSQLEKVAAAVIFPFRPAYHNREESKTGPEDAQLILAKNRFGPSNVVEHVLFDPPRALFMPKAIDPSKGLF